MSRTVLDGPKVLKRFQSTFTVQRGSAGFVGTLVDGNYTLQSGTPQIFIFTGTVTSLKGSEAKMLPDGVRVHDTIVIHVANRLFETDPMILRLGDKVVYNGYLYRVFSVEPWNEFGKFWKAMAERLNT